MADTQERLKKTLADRYALKGAVGHGGAATVYLAEDLKHRRKVAVKVLRPEIAGALGGDRFLREIEIAAGLQHPHVVPLYDSGEADGLLYYVMPYLGGETLSARLERHGQLPIEDALRILRDIADALAYAHQRGVVHRDIKPDNVMLSGSHAVVMDFGVAKALTEAADSTAITSSGLALGTPAYMAPEQATADPAVDHRADIYALGVMAYEMVAGRLPFDGDTPQKVLAAHITATPAPVEKYRSDVPPQVSTLISRCLEKEPDRRIQDTSDLLQQLGSLATPSGTVTLATPPPVTSGKLKFAQFAALYSVTAAAVAGISHTLMLALGLPRFVFTFTLVLLVLGVPILLSTLRLELRRAPSRSGTTPVVKESILARMFTWRRAVSGGVVAFVGLALLAAAYTLMRTMGIGPVGTLVATGVLEERDRVILADFVDRSGDTTLAAAVTEAFRVDLGQSPIVTLVQDGDLAEAFARMEREVPERITVDLAHDVAMREGIKAIVYGEISTVGGSYVLSAQLREAASGNILVPLRETASDSTDLIEALDRLSKQLRERVGESLKSIRAGPALERVTTASLPALRKYSQASRAMHEGDAGRAVALFQDAIAMDTAFAAAHRALSIQLTNYGIDRALAATSMNRAYQYRDRLTDKERLWTEGSYHMARDETARALSAYHALLELEPEDAAVLNNIGVLYNLNRQNERALEYFERSRDLEPTSANAAFNIIVNNIELGRLAEAREENERFAAAAPDHPFFHVHRFFIAVAESNYDMAEEAMEAWSEFGDEAGEALVTSSLLGLAGIRGRISTAERIFDASRTRAESGRQVREYLLDAIAMGLLEINARDNADAGVARVSEALQEFRLSRLEPFDRPYLELAEFYARAGLAERARQMLGAYETEVELEFRTLAGGQHQRTRGFVALAEDRIGAALDHFRRSDQGSCTVCVLPAMAQAYERMGAEDSLFAVLDRYVNSSDDDRFPVDAVELPGAYVRLGELQEARGRRERAIEYYNRFVNLWSNADPELRPQVEDVEQRISRLAAESGTSQ